MKLYKKIVNEIKKLKYKPRVMTVSPDVMGKLIEEMVLNGIDRNKFEFMSPVVEGVVIVCSE